MASGSLPIPVFFALRTAGVMTSALGSFAIRCRNAGFFLANVALLDTLDMERHFRSAPHRLEDDVQREDVPGTEVDPLTPTPGRIIDVDMEAD